MHELRASRINYKRSLANLKLVLQARRFESREWLRLCRILDLFAAILELTYFAQRNTEVIQAMTEGRQLDVRYVCSHCPICIFFQFAPPHVRDAPSTICSDSILVQHLIEVTSGHIKHALLEAADVVKKEGQQVSKHRTLYISGVIYCRARSCNRLLTICSKFRLLLRTLKNIWTHCFWPWLNGRSKAVGRMRAARLLLQEHR